MKQKMRKLKSFLAAFALALTAAVQMPHIEASAANTYWKFDFGGGGTDFTHFTESGAKVTAGIICSGIKGMSIPLAKEVR